MNDLSNFAARLCQVIPRKPGILGLEEFNAFAVELFALQFALNEPYRRFCEARGILPAHGRDWRAIPAVPAAAFKEWDLSCLAVSERRRVFHSSGTTRHRPSRHFHSDQSLMLYEASLIAGFAAAAWTRGNRSPANVRMLLLTPPGAQAPNSSLVHMFEIVRDRFGTGDSIFAGRIGQNSNWEVDGAVAMQVLEEAVSDGEPLFVLGTAFGFVHLADYLAEHDRAFKLPAGSLLMETGGYKGRSRTLPRHELRALLRRCFGPSEILCEYGMSELSSQAYARGTADGGVFEFPAWTRSQIISPETGQEVAEGEIGLIRVVDLANAFSVLAIQTEDLGIRRGTGFELIGRAESAEPRGCSLMSA